MVDRCFAAVNKLNTKHFTCGKLNYVKNLKFLFFFQKQCGKEMRVVGFFHTFVAFAMSLIKIPHR
jgi:hypothetical protein